jgi:hypothetical protein
MVQRFLPLLVIALSLTLLLAGCAGTTPSRVSGTPAVTTPVLPPTTEIPPVTAMPESFPGALPLGTPYLYGRADIAMDVTVYKVEAMDEYDWWSPEWGRYWNTSPKKGNHFLFALIRLVDRGTARARLPSESMFVLRGDGGSYVQTTDRDNSLWIKGIDVKQYDFYYDLTAGWIDPGESNKVESFLLYEVPASLTPDHAYLQATFSSKANATWKLG